MNGNPELKIVRLINPSIIPGYLDWDSPPFQLVDVEGYPYKVIDIEGDIYTCQELTMREFIRMHDFHREVEKRWDQERDFAHMKARE